MRERSFVSAAKTWRAAPCGGTRASRLFSATRSTSYEGPTTGGASPGQPPGMAVVAASVRDKARSLACLRQARRSAMLRRPRICHALSPGAKLNPDVERELRRWLAVKLAPISIMMPCGSRPAYRLEC